MQNIKFRFCVKNVFEDVQSNLLVVLQYLKIKYEQLSCYQSYSSVSPLFLYSSSRSSPIFSIASPSPVFT